MKNILFCLFSSVAFFAHSEPLSPTPLFVCEESYGNVLIHVSVVQNENHGLEGRIISHHTSGPWNSNVLVHTAVHEIVRGNTRVYNESKGQFYIRFENESVYAEATVRGLKMVFNDLKCSPRP